MRFLNRDLIRLSLYRPQSVKSDYVGTEVKIIYLQDIFVNLQYNDDSLNDEKYGKKYIETYKIYIEKFRDVQIDDYVGFYNSSPVYKVISVRKYKTHVVAVIEKIQRSLCEEAVLARESA